MSRLIYFSLFDNCNVKCNMCDCWVRPRTHRSFSWYADGLRELLRQRPNAIRFTGGEPLLYPHLGDLIAIAREAGSRVSVITNGRLLASKVGHLAESGCAEIVLSVDAYGTLHDEVRGTRGLFDKVVAGLVACQEFDVPIGINTVIQRRNIGEIMRLGEWIVNQPVQRRPRWWHHIPVRGDPVLVPTPDQLERFSGEYRVIRSIAESAGCKVIGHPEPFAERALTPCTVPTFVRFVRADRREIYGCNILSYTTLPVEVIVPGVGPITQNGGPDNLAESTRAARFDACARCDPASRRMNFYLAEMPLHHNNDTQD